MSVFINM